MVGFFLGCAHSEPAATPARKPVPDTTGRPNVVPRVSTEPTAWERDQVRQTAARERREQEEYERRAALQLRRAEQETRQAERERRTTEKQLAREYARAQAAAERNARRLADRQKEREAESLRKQAHAARAQREAQEYRLKTAADRKAATSAAIQDARRNRDADGRNLPPAPLFMPAAAGTVSEQAQPVSY